MYSLARGRRRSRWELWEAELKSQGGRGERRGGRPTSPGLVSDRRYQLEQLVSGFLDQPIRFGAGTWARPQRYSPLGEGVAGVLIQGYGLKEDEMDRRGL